MAVPDETKETKVSPFKNLINRRVPQIMGIYLAASWGIVQFVEWIVNRYLLSPNLTDLALVILLSLIPSSLIVAYYHGRPGRDRWKKTEKVGIPFNIAVSIFLVLFFFGDKDLGTVSQKVAVEDETGKKIERLIPKSNFRKKIAVFSFDNKTGDASLDWMQYGVSLMYAFDLSQDMFFEVVTPYAQGVAFLDFYIYDKIKEAGYPDMLGLPLSLQRKIAGESYMEYFLTGKISREGEELILESSLYLTKNSKLVAQTTVRGKDLFKLIDDLTVRLKEDLELPGGYIEETDDLPVAEMFTTSLEAARLFTLGQNAMAFQKDQAKAQDYYEKAIREDPTFALAYSQLGVIYLITNQNKKGVETVQASMKYSYKLPERWQLYTKISYFTNVKQDPGKRMAILKMMVKLYPEDLQAHAFLALYLTLGNMPDEAIATYKRMLEIDPRRYEIFEEIGSLYEVQGRFDQAMDYYRQYAERFPNKSHSYIIIGNLNKKMGNLEQAKENYEKAAMLAPESISVLTVLSNLETNTGNFTKAADLLEEALQAARKAKDRFKVYGSLSNFYEFRGRVGKALEYQKLMIKEFEEFSVPLMVLFVKISSIDAYVRAGEEEEASRILASTGSQLKPPFDKYAELGYLLMYLEMEKPDEAEKHLPGFQQLIKTLGVEMLESMLHKARARIHEMRGQYAEAIESYEAQLKIAPGNEGGLRGMGRCYRRLEQYDKAEEYIQKTLKVSPFDPKSNYELALVYLDMGEKEKAIKHLQRTVDVWKDADAVYKPAQRAKEKLAELK